MTVAAVLVFLQAALNGLTALALAVGLAALMGDEPFSLGLLVLLVVIVVLPVVLGVALLRGSRWGLVGTGLLQILAMVGPVLAGAQQLASPTATLPSIALPVAILVCLWLGRGWFAPRG